MILALLLTALCAHAADRVILVTFDGFGYQRWLDNDVVKELPTLQRLAREGAHADGIIAHFPSTTSNSHAAIYTGVYGDQNGISANDNAILPRREHTFLERSSGFRSEGLRVEPIWATAARLGIRTVAHQVTQAFPFAGPTIANGEAKDLVIVNGYQSKRHADDAVITSNNVQSDDSPLPGAVEDTEGKRIRWAAGSITFHAMFDNAGVQIWADGSNVVRAALAEAETRPPKGRALARHFSDSLYLPFINAGVFFRLFSRNGDDFVLYHSPVRELAFYGSSTAAARLIRDCGGFYGNAANYLYEHDRFGVRLSGGLAERRYLETVELNARQSTCHSSWLWKEFQPGFFVDYFNQPDDLDHAMLGFGEKGLEYRRWGYQAIEYRLAALTRLIDEDDHIFLTSDHGMTATSRRLHVNAVLANAGLMDRATCLQGGILLNMADWKNGIVTEDKKPEVLDNVRRALQATNVISEFFDFDGGPNGPDLYFDVEPGIYAVCDKETAMVTTDKLPSGTHGMNPRRADMLAILFAAGPTIKAGATIPRMRSVEIHRIVLDLLKE